MKIVSKSAHISVFFYSTKLSLAWDEDIDPEKGYTTHHMVIWLSGALFRINIIIPRKWQLHCLKMREIWTLLDKKNHFVFASRSI